MSLSGKSMVAWLVAVAACTPADCPRYSGFLDAPVAQVASQVAGRVDAMLVREGDSVRAAQVLAQLDARERKAAVAQAEANLELARQATKQAEANLHALFPTLKGAVADIAAAQASFDESEINFRRAEQLVGAKAIPEADLITARARMLEARARLESLTASRAATQGRLGASLAAVASARAAVGTAQAAVDMAQVQLSEAQVLAPFDGLVVQRNLQPGEWAAPGTPVVTVEDPSQLWVRLDIEETRLEGLELGQAAEVQVIALPGQTFSGHVIQIGAQGDFAVNRDVKRGRPDLRTFMVRVGVDERSAALRAGMTAEVAFPALSPTHSASARR